MLDETTSRLRPGDPEVFNLPADAHPERLEPHESLFGDGTELRVLDR